MLWARAALRRRCVFGPLNQTADQSDWSSRTSQPSTATSSSLCCSRVTARRRPFSYRAPLPLRRLGPGDVSFSAR